MLLSVTLIRSGLTQSGKDGLYLGRYDEMLLEEGACHMQRKAADGNYPPAELVYIGKQFRCRETAGLIYPNVPAVVVDNLDAFDYGVYTGLSYYEITRDKHFTQWADESEIRPFENGENPHELFARGTQAFHSITDEMLHKGIENASVITHKLIISAILQRFYAPRRSYANWAADCGGGYTLEYNSRTMVATIKGQI